MGYLLTLSYLEHTPSLKCEEISCYQNTILWKILLQVVILVVNQSIIKYLSKSTLFDKLCQNNQYKCEFQMQICQAAQSTTVYVYLLDLGTSEVLFNDLLVGLFISVSFSQDFILNAYHFHHLQGSK